MTDHEVKGPGNVFDRDDVVQRLLRGSGRRPAVDAQRQARVRAVVEQRWRERTAASQKVVRFPSRRVLTGVAAALILATVGVVWKLGSPTGFVVGDPIGTVELIRGGAQYVRSAGVASTVLEVGREVVSGAAVQTGENSQVAIRLDDGHSVRLDRNSRVVFDGLSTIDLLDGAVYLDSAGSRGDGVEVSTGLGSVFEIGTQFEVRIVPGGLQIRVREGRVVVDGGDERHEVAAGRQLLRHVDGRVEIEDSQAYGEQWSWVGEVAPAYPLDGRRLDEYLVWLARETGFSISFEPENLGASVAAIQLHGELPSVRPELTPHIVLPTCGLAWEIHGDVLTIAREHGNR